MDGRVTRATGQDGLESVELRDAVTVICGGEEYPEEGKAKASGDRGFVI